MFAPWLLAKPLTSDKDLSKVQFIIGRDSIWTEGYVLNRWQLGNTKAKGKQGKIKSNLPQFFFLSTFSKIIIHHHLGVVHSGFSGHGGTFMGWAGKNGWQPWTSTRLTPVQCSPALHHVYQSTASLWSTIMWLWRTATKAQAECKKQSEWVRPSTCWAEWAIWLCIALVHLFSYYLCVCV